ncbi:unnamed protein product, partial [Strongylus vulgaris]
MPPPWRMGVTFQPLGPSSWFQAQRDDEVKEFENKMEEEKTQLKAKVAELASNLTDSLEKFWVIADNLEQTPIDERHALEKLGIENPPLYRVISFMIDQFVPFPRRSYKPYGPGGHEHEHGNMVDGPHFPRFMHRHHK